MYITGGTVNITGSIVYRYIGTLYITGGILYITGGITDFVTYDNLYTRCSLIILNYTR